MKRLKSFTAGFVETFKTVFAVMSLYRYPIAIILIVLLGGASINMAHSQGYNAGYAAAKVVPITVDAYEAKEDVRIKRYAITNHLIRTYAVDINEAFRLADYFLESAAEFTIDPYLLVAQTWAESRFINGAVSVDGAVGLMQVMPKYWANGEIFFVKSAADLRNPRINIRASAYIMRHYANIAEGLNVANLTESTLRAYHGGEPAITKPLAETLEYVNIIKTKYKSI